MIKPQSDDHLYETFALEVFKRYAVIEYFQDVCEVIRDYFVCRVR